jgi:hypothetical protein
MLLIVVAWICAYLACWGPTNERGVVDVTRYVSRPPHRLIIGKGEWHSVKASPTFPLILSFEGVRSWDLLDGPPTYLQHRYYFWFFGYVVKLPCEWEEPVADPVHWIDVGRETVIEY